MARPLGRGGILFRLSLVPRLAIIDDFPDTVIPNLLAKDGIAGVGAVNDLLARGMGGGA